MRYTVLLTAFLIVTSQFAFGQCGVLPTITQQEYCLNQKAEIRITDANPNVRYHWYEELSLGNQLDLQYGEDGDGRYMVSNQNVTTTGSHDYYFVKEEVFTVGPTYRAPAGGDLYAVNQTEYDMEFDASIGFRLDSVTVVVEMTSPTDEYMFEIMNINSANDTSFSRLFTATRDNFVPLGVNLYQVRFPVLDPSPVLNQGLTIGAGTGQTIEFRSVAAANGTDYVAVDNIYWWGDGEYAGGSYANNTIDVFDSEDEVNSDTRTPLIMDWAITQTCPQQTVTVTESTDCCVPVGEDITLVSDAFQNLVQPGQLPVTLTAGGGDVTAGMFFYWFDANGTEVAGGQNVDTYDAPATGLYTVRVVNDAADKESAACYTKTSIYLDSTNIYTNGDQFICVGAPLNLEAFGGEGNYEWTQVSGPSSTINTPNVSTTSVDITQPGTYVFQVEADVLLDDIAVDGKFEQWDDAANFDNNLEPRLFETDYGPAVGGGGVFINNNGQIRVDNDIVAWSANGNAICDNLEDADHDVFLYADAMNSSLPDNTTATPVATLTNWALAAGMWRLTNQPVAQNTTYSFSIDVANWGGGGASGSLMMLHVNGQPLDLVVNGAAQGHVYQVPTDCQWFTVTGTWNSGTDPTATIVVSEVGNADLGHELAIDNITFNAGLGRETSTVTIEVDQVLDPGTNEYCDGGGVQTTLSVDGVTNYNWYEDATGATELSNSTTPGVFVDWTPLVGTTGDQTVYVQNSGSSAIAGGSPFGPSVFDYNEAVTAHATDFTVHSSVVFASFAVSSPTWNGSCQASGTSDPIQYELVNNGTGAILTYQQAVNCGSQTIITPNWVVAPGDYTLRVNPTIGNPPQHSVTGNIASPQNYSLAGYLDITGYLKANDEGIFKNWEILTSDACGAPAPIVVRAVSCCTPPTDDPTIDGTASNLEECEGDEASLSIVTDAITNGLDYQWEADFGSGFSDFGSAGTVAGSGVVSLSGITQAGDYRIRIAEAGNINLTCTKTSPEVTIVINEVPTDPTVTTPVEICSGDPLELASASTVGSGTITYAWTGPNSYTSAQQNPTVSASASSTMSGTYTVTATANGCSAANGTDVVVTVNASPVITVDEPTETECEGTTIDITDNFSVAPGTATLTYYDGPSATGSVISNQAAITSSGTYYLLAETGTTVTCSDEESTVVTINPTPVAALTIDDNTICSGDNATMSITVTTGTGDFDITYNGDGGTGDVTANSEPSPFNATVNTEETFTIVSITDANNCTADASDLSGNPTIVFDPEVVAIESRECNDVNGSLAIDEYQIRITATDGDLGSIVVTSVPAMTFTDEGGGVWLSPAINENTPVNVNVTDMNDCNGGHDFIGLQQSCSCPEIATITGGESICEEGTPSSTALSVNFTGGTVGQLYDFEIFNSVDNSLVQAVTGHNGDSPFPLIVNGPGVYQVRNLTGSCDGTGSGNATVDYFPSPEGVISGGGTICDNATATTDVVIDFTNVATPFDFVFSGGSETAFGGSQYELTTDAVATYDWAGGTITDANGCTAKAADLTGSVDIDYYDDPAVDPASITYDCPNDQNLPYEYDVSFTVTGGEGTGNYVIDELIAGTMTDAGVTATEVGGVVTITGVPETMALDIGVTDGNACNPILVPSLNTVCSCPTSATLSVSGTDEICDDGSTVTLEINTIGGTGDYSYVVQNSQGVPVESQSNFDAFPHFFTVDEDETYSIASFYDNGETCDASLTGNIKVTVNPLPTATLSATGTQNICTGDATDDFQIVFTGNNGPFNYGYTLDANPEITGTTNSTIEIIPGVLTAGNYVMTSVSDSKCTGTVSGTIPVTQQDRPEANLVMVGGDICAGEVAPALTVTFTQGTQPFSIKYKDTENPEQTVTPINATTYSIPGATTVGNYSYSISELSDDNCPAVASGLTGNAIYSVHALPTFSTVIASDDTICSDGSDDVTMTVIFTGATPIDYNYTTPTTGPILSSTGVDLTNEHISAEAGLHTFDNIIDANTCSALNSGSYTIYHSAPLSLDITGEDTVCEVGGLITLTVSGQDGNPVTWSNGETGSTITLNSPGESGIYTVTADDGICPISSTLVASDSVLIDEEPVVSISGSEIQLVVFEGDPISLTGVVNDSRDGVLWSSDNGLNGLDGINDIITSFSPLEGGNYNYTLTAFNGECDNSASINVVVIQPVKIPNAFTPNGDGDNEVWDIRGLGTYSEAVVKIYNRWGNLVYENYGTYKQWDGSNRSKGKQLPTGTYYYMIDLGIEIPGAKQDKEMKGHVSIIR